MRFLTDLENCLYLNWAVPVGSAPRPPGPLRYEVHPTEEGPRVLASLLVFRNTSMRIASSPWPSLSYPQANLRYYVLDGDGVPAVWFRRMAVPAWALPAVRWTVGEVVRPGRLRHGGDDWRWELHSRAGGFAIDARAGSTLGVAPNLGAGSAVVRYFSRRSRGYAVRRGRLRRVDATHRAAAPCPVQVTVGDGGWIQDALGAEMPPQPHSAWVFPRMSFEFEAVAAKAAPLPGEVPAPG